MTWNDQFLTLFDRCLTNYKSGNRDFNGYYSEDDLSFLGSIGYKQESFSISWKTLATLVIPLARQPSSSRQCAETTS